MCFYFCIPVSPQAPLHLAAREGNGKCIEVLLENGANLSLENTRRETALALASDPFSRMKIEQTIARFEVPKRNRNDEDVVKGQPSPMC